METPELFDQIAAHYDRWSNLLSAEGIRTWHRFAIDQLAIQPGHSVLDVGCGTGAVTTLMAAKAGAHGHVIGLDPAPSMLANAKLRQLHPDEAPIQWVMGRGEDLPFAEGQFDRVTAQFSLRNMEDWVQGLTELVRVLNPGGRLVVLDVVQPTSSLGSLAWNGLKTVTEHLGSESLAPYQWLGLSVEHAPTSDEMVYEAKRVGLADVHVHHWLGDLVMVLSGEKRDSGRPLLTEVEHDIVWAVDGSVTALRAGDWLNAVAAPGSQVDIVTVIPPTAAPSDVAEHADRAWRSHARMAYEHLTPQRFCVTTTILHGQPGPAILQFCQRHHTRLLVAGNKGRSARADHWIGSVARYVEEHAVCPVVLLPINHDGSL